MVEGIIARLLCSERAHCDAVLELPYDRSHERNTAFLVLELHLQHLS